MQKISEMLIAVSGDLFEVDSREKLQVHLELVKDAWNMSLYSANKRKAKLKMMIEKQRPYAPSEQALKGLEWEYRRIMKQKDTLFPSVRKKVVGVEALETGKDDFTIRAYSVD